jgi:predicted O-linked N-acetylglucosamine transferase (SPINDLY family)
MGGHQASALRSVSASSLHKLKQARERLQQGDAAGAQFLCEQVLERAPRNPDALCLLGVAHLVNGRAGEAAPLLERAVAAAPRDGIALEHLGLAHLMLGRFADAEHMLRRAAALPGAPPSVGMRLGAAILHQGRAGEAIAELARALQRAPDSIDCHLNLGRAHAELGDTASARRHFETVLRLDPGHADAMFNLGVLALGDGNLDEAGSWFKRTLAAHPQHADAIVNLGIVLERQGRIEDAAASFRRALEIDPGHAVARSNLGHVLAAQGRHEEAREQYLAAVELAPGHATAREGLASVCRALGRIGEAVAHLREATRLEPQNSAAIAALAEALFQSGELAEAIELAQRAITIAPEAAPPYSVLAQAHFVRGELDLAIETLRSGCARTGSDSLLGMLALHQRQVCDWEGWRAAWERLAPRLAESADLGTPFSLLYEPTTAQQQLAYARRWAALQFRTGASSSGAAAPRPAGPRLRVGYLSSDFHAHATAYLLAEVLELHDRSRFEIYAYSYGPDDASPMRARLTAACEHFVDIRWEPDDVAARRIRGDAIDILVDLKGYTMGARTTLPARRLAPVQVQWLGYPGTMGADFIDHVIADPFVIPPGQEGVYSENVLRLPHCYQPNDRQRPVGMPLSRAEYGLPPEGFVFCCFTQGYKVAPEVFTCWMRLLAAVPGSVLWMLEDNRWAVRNLKAHARERGIAPERLLFAPRLPLAEHLARYRAADLSLDTFPYTAHTTASDALWAGCPLVALCGETFAARVSGSILAACGLPELITHTLEDYESLALRLARDSAYMEEVRAKLAEARASAPLFDAEGFTRALERLYLDIASK